MPYALNVANILTLNHILQDNGIIYGVQETNLKKFNFCFL